MYIAVPQLLNSVAIDSKLHPGVKRNFVQDQFSLTYSKNIKCQVMFKNKSCEFFNGEKRDIKWLYSNGDILIVL